MLLARLLQDLSYMRSPDSRGETLHERELSSMSRSRSSYTQNAKTLETNFYSPPTEENEDEDLLIIAVYLTLFVIIF